MEIEFVKILLGLIIFFSGIIFGCCITLIIFYEKD